MYKKDHVKAKFRVNGKLSDKACHINSGTRQGCLLSPLIFAVVADLFNMSVICNPDFTGHITGDDKALSAKAITERIAKVYAQI